MKRYLCFVVFVACTPSRGPSSATVATAERDPRADRPERRNHGAAAFRVERAGDLVSGPKARGRIGDVRIGNAEVAFVIGAIGVPEGFAASGGNVIDAGHVGRANDCLSQVFTYFARKFPRQAFYTKLEIVRDGADGGDAVVRASGADSDDAGLAVTTNYVVRQAGRALRITTTIENRGANDYARFGVGDAVLWGCVKSFAPRHGVDLPGRSGDVEFLASLGQRVSYGYVARRAFHAVSSSSWSDTTLDEPALPRGASVSFERSLVVGDGDTASLHVEVAAARGERWHKVAGVVREAGSARPVAKARVEVESKGGEPFAFARADGAGAFEVLLPRGEYRLAASARDRARGSAVSVQVGVETPSDVSLEVSARGSLRYKVVEARSGETMPAKLTFLGVNGTPDPRFGLPFQADGAANVVMSPTGEGEVGVPPGAYDVVVSRGPFFGAAPRRVVVKPGEPATETWVSARLVDTNGFLCADFHQHAAPSADSPTPLRDRVVANLAEGVDILVSTDHDAHTDYAPVISEVGATRLLASIVGVEATTETVGHFNAYPVRHDPEKPRGGGRRVEGMTPAEIMKTLRAESGAGIIQVNHPRGLNGYFDLVKERDLSFDAIEVFNGKHVDDARRVMRDWFDLLKRGHRFIATGGSDAHSIFGQEVGYPRTCIYFGHSDPSKVDDAALIRAMRFGARSVVTNGPFVRVRVDGAETSPLVRRQKGRVTVSTDVEAAPWVHVDRVLLYANGEEVGRWSVKCVGIRCASLKRTLNVENDVWFVAVASGSRPLAPVVPAARGKAVTPLGFTNPVWVKVE